MGSWLEWDCYCDNHVGDEFVASSTKPTWETFVHALKEDFYSIGNYDENFVPRKSPKDVRFYQYIPYLTLKDSYQRLLMELGPKLLQFPT